MPFGQHMTIPKRKMMEKNENKITSLSDAEFLSFLYSERDREKESGGQELSYIHLCA